VAEKNASASNCSNFMLHCQAGQLLMKTTKGFCKILSQNIMGTAIITKEVEVDDSFPGSS
jgi:hypothetical protein